MTCLMKTSADNNWHNNILLNLPSDITEIIGKYIKFNSIRIIGKYFSKNQLKELLEKYIRVRLFNECSDNNFINMNKYHILSLLSSKNRLRRPFRILLNDQLIEMFGHPMIPIKDKLLNFKFGDLLINNNMFKLINHNILNKYYNVSNKLSYIKSLIEIRTYNYDIDKIKIPFLSKIVKITNKTYSLQFFQLERIILNTYDNTEFIFECSDMDYTFQTNLEDINELHTIQTIKFKGTLKPKIYRMSIPKVNGLFKNSLDMCN